MLATEKTEKTNETQGRGMGSRKRWSQKTGMALALLAVMALFLSGCGVKRVALPACSDRRLDLAVAMFDQARAKLTLHFRQRVDTALSESYQASQDSVLLARATRNCHDFDAVVRRQAIDLIKSNLLFQKLITSNMRDQDPGVVVDLYGSRYREIFRSDIQ